MTQHTELTDNRQLDAKVAELMGRVLVRNHSEFLKWGDGCEPLPHYTTDASADYLVLEYVRENWDEGKLDAFGRRLDDMWESRCEHAEHVWILYQYQPGDYSRAALTVAEIEVE